MNNLVEIAMNCVAATSHTMIASFSGLGLGATILETSRGHYFSALFCLGASFMFGYATYDLQKKDKEMGVLVQAYSIINQENGYN